MQEKAAIPMLPKPRYKPLQTTFPKGTRNFSIKTGKESFVSGKRKAFLKFVHRQLTRKKLLGENIRFKAMTVTVP